MTIDGDVTIHARRGDITFLTRNDTNDAALVVGILADDEYGLSRLPLLFGVAIDIGAHIGTVALALAKDHAGLRVIAVEPVPENVEVLRANIAHNHLEDRVTVIQAAGGKPGAKTAKMLWNYRSAGQEPEAYVKDSRYIANIYDGKDSDADAHRVKSVSLDDLMDGLDTLALLKVDCEGCEWDVLRSPRVKDVKIIIGEWHNGPRLAGLRALLDATHVVTQTGGHDDVGTFRAVAR